MPSPNPRPRRNHKREAIERVEAALRRLADGTASIVEVAAPETGIYVQFSGVAGSVVGEAVGEANLPKLFVHHMGEHLREALPRLGWSPPEAGAPTSGNWSRVWSPDSLREADVARIVVATFSDAYGIHPWALVVRAGP